jgi:hypothetical protein
MSRPFRYLTRLIVGMGALVLTGLGGAAFARVPPPDSAAPTAQPQLVSVAHTVSDSGSSVWTVLLVVAGAIVLGVLFTGIVHGLRRHRPASHPLTG